MYEIDLYDGRLIWIKTSALTGLNLFHHNNNYYTFTEIKTFGDYTCILLSVYKVEGHTMTLEDYNTYLSTMNVGDNKLSPDGTYIIECIETFVEPKNQVVMPLGQFPSNSWIEGN